MSQQFSINQKVFEINFFSKEKAYELQNRISGLVNGELPVLMNRYFESVIPEEFLYKIDNLVLDLGEVKYDNLESELPEKFMEALVKELADRLKFVNDPALAQQSGITISRSNTTNADLLEYFLLMGRLPWWAERNVDIEKVLDDLFANQRQVLRELVIKTGKYDYVRRRLVNHFHGSRIRKIIETLEPTEATYIFGYHEEVVKIQQEEQLVKTEQKEFEKAVWLFIFQYLLADRGGEFNRKEFVRNTMAQIAANFNVAYFDLLHIFFNALTLHEAGAAHITSLEQVIRELSSEDPVFIERETELYASQKQQVPDTASIMDKLDLLRHYILYGTVPAWSDDLTQEKLVALFFEMASKVPHTFKQVLFAAGISKDVTQKLFTLFGVQGTKAFLKLVYPAKARTISNIAATFEMLQTEKVLVSSGNSTFQEVLWKMLFEIVMAAELAITDDRVIVHSLIAGIRKYYGMPVKALVENISEGIRSVFYKDMRNLQHIDLFQRVLEEYDTAIAANKDITVNAISIDNVPQKEVSETETRSRESTSLRDLLRFLIRYGSMPWWARQYFANTPEQLLRKLLSSSQREALLFLKFAGAAKTTRERFLIQFSEELVLDIIRSIASGETAIRIFEQLRTVITIAEPETDAGTLLNILWDELIDRDYHTISETGIYTKAIARLSIAFNRSALEVINAMEAAVTGWTGESVTRLKALFATIAAVFIKEEETKPKVKKARKKPQDFVLQEYLFSSFAMIVVPKGKTEVDLVREWLAVAEENVRVDITGKVFSILGQFLAAGSLPDSLGISDKAVADAFLKKLMILAYHIDAEKLAAVFDSDSRGVLAVAHLVGLLKESAGGEEKAAALFLRPVIDKKAYPFNDVVETRSGSSDVVTLENIISEYTSETIITSPQKLVETTVAILEYFLLWNKLPEQLVLPAGISPEEFLNKLLLLLFEKDRNILQTLLHNEEYQPAAAMRLFTSVRSSSGGEEKLVAVFLAKTMGDDIEKLFMGRDELISVPEVFVPDASAVLVTEKTLYEKIAAGETDLILQNRAAVNFISESGDSRLYETLLQKTNYLPFDGYIAVTKGMPELFAKMFTDTLVREKMINLFKRFNLGLAAGKVSFQNRYEYFLSFFHFMERSRSTVSEVWQKMLDYLQEPANKTLSAPITNDSVGMRRALRFLLKQQDERVIDDTEIRKQPAAVAEQVPVDKAAAERKKLMEQVAKELEAERLRDDQERKRKALENIKEKNTKIYIANSGIVILHPFFSTYFTRLGLVENGAFVDLEKQARGVLLLQYLVTGRQKFEEHELVLNKILCGMPLEEPVPVEIEISEAEKNISDEIFEVLKQRWDKVKNSSVEGIRASFFQREGALEETEEGNWTLRVEQRGYDMLLQTLPWAFGFIKLPWMSKILTVEWI